MVNVMGWEVSRRNGYSAVDEYDVNGRMIRTIVSGVTAKVARLIVDAYNQGVTDGKKEK